MKTFTTLAALAAATTAFALPEKRADLPAITVKGNGMHLVLDQQSHD